jgi:CheY-like chemotaxis protein
VRIEVWDTGPGIALDDRDVIFEAFRRGDAAAGQGLGLGLAIAERTAALLRHPLSLRSWPGLGSVFDVAAPVAPRGVIETVPPPALVAPGTGHAVVVDNDPVALLATATLLRGLGWTVDALRTPEGHASAPDLLVLDYHLDAGRTGLEALRVLRGRFGDVPTVFVTADRDVDLRTRLQEAGGSVLYKPLKPLAMRQAMQRLVARA